MTTEALYGLGQQQLGTVDIKGYDMDLWQRNTRVVVPMLVSSSGYGIFWDNMSYTRFGDLRPFVPIPAETPLRISIPADGAAAAAARGPRTPTWKVRLRRRPPATTRSRLIPTARSRSGWTESRSSTTTPELADRRRPGKGAPGGQPPLTSSWIGAQRAGITCSSNWKTPSPEADKTALWSEVADGVDYYFIYGPKIDSVVAGYRLLTGQAPMMPQWAFGLWQSRQKYNTAQESLDVVKGFRSRQILSITSAGLAVLEGGCLGLSRVRPGALPRPGRLDQVGARPARALDDIGVG